MTVDTLVRLSRFYGADKDYVIAGGGNTSIKDGEVLYVKGSGTALGEIDAAGFVRMDRSALAKIWEKRYPRETDAREAAVLADMMAARLPGEEAKRPSVETLLHGLLPFALVVHTHPARVNGLTCSVQGEEAARRLFGEDALWIPSMNPGYVLAVAVKDAADRYTARRGRPPAIIFLQNHGVFVGADTEEGIKERYAFIMETIGRAAPHKPPEARPLKRPENAAGLAETLAESSRFPVAKAPAVLFRFDGLLAPFLAGRKAFAPVSSAFTPDHIVYAGSDPLFIGAGEPVEVALEEHRVRTGRRPKIIAVENTGVFGIGESEKAAGLALDLFSDAAKVASWAANFGGPRFMSADQIDFINTWEVERYRSRVAEK